MTREPGTTDAAAIHLVVTSGDIAALERLLRKMQAAELSDLRRVQTQLAVYGDRRSNMDGEPAAIEARLALVASLLDQIETQRRSTNPT